MTFSSCFKKEHLTEITCALELYQLSYILRDSVLTVYAGRTQGLAFMGVTLILMMSSVVLSLGHM